MSESDLNQKRIASLAEEISGLRQRTLAIALDFDGVCKLFTEFKHQIMFTGLFLHLSEFQRVPFDELRTAYLYINFRSPEYAGRERFLCVSALSEHLAAKGYDCALPDLSRTVQTILSQGKKLNPQEMKGYAELDAIRRILAWSDEVNERVSSLTEIGLAPGLRENILDPFQDRADFYVVSTATEALLEESLRREGVTSVRRFIGQETASKAEALLAMCHAGYEKVAMFGDCIGDQDATTLAQKNAPEHATIAFAPVISGDERASFEGGGQIVEALDAGDVLNLERLCQRMADAFAGHGVTVHLVDSSGN